VLDPWEDILRRPEAGTPEGFVAALPSMLTGELLHSCSSTHEVYFPSERPAHIVRFENMRAELQDFFRERRVPVKRGLLTALRNADAKNVSKHRHYRDYYDATTRDLVARADRAIIERYGYEF
jgi:hypothetical protein